MSRKQSFLISLVVLAALLSVPARVAAQASTIRGTVVGPDGRPIEGANVFILETLDGVETHADGRFSLPAATPGMTVVARKLGFIPLNTKLTVPPPDSIIVRLERAAPQLTEITVLAGRYTANEERTATLTSLEVVTTPGTAADVNRAIQTLPGIQQVDEGTGLFVRGGDYTETKVFLNEASILNPLDIQSPNGTFMGSVDPFLLDGIVFSSGGFGARFGNALSAAVDLHTQRKAGHTAVSASLGLAGISLSGATPISKKAGIRVAANLVDLRPLIALNGSATEYDPAPRGHDLSAGFGFTSPTKGELLVFAIEKNQTLGVSVEDPAYSGTFSLWSKSRLATATWRATFGKLSHTVSASAGTLGKNEDFGTFELRTRFQQQQAFAQTAYTQSDRLTLRAGGEIERLGAAFDGSIPNTALDVKPGSRIRKLGSDETGTRKALFTEADTRIGQRVRLVAGIRADDSNLTQQTTLDPRISAAVKTLGSATLTAAWGVYHEVPDAILFDPVLGDPALPSMRAVHSIIGGQAGDNERMVRIELYDKQYTNLARQTRDFGVGSNGEGSARGADLFLKGNGPAKTQMRLTYSYVESHRTDPNTGIMARAPFDVPHSATFIVQKSISNWNAGAAWRYATGRPFTPVTSATFSTLEDRWIPNYGVSNSERLPALTRVDLSLSNVRRISSDWRVVMYASVNNLLARHNIYNYTYSQDFTQRKPVASLFDRSLYFGATLLH